MIRRLHGPDFVALLAEGFAGVGFHANIDDEGFAVTVYDEMPNVVMVDTSAPGLVSLSEVLLGDNRLSASGQIQYDPDRLMVSTEEIPVTDPRLQSAWGPRLSRIIFKLSNPPAQSQLDFKIS